MGHCAKKFKTSSGHGGWQPKIGGRNGDSHAFTGT